MINLPNIALHPTCVRKLFGIVLPIENYTFERLVNHNFIICNDRYQFNHELCIDHNWRNYIFRFCGGRGRVGFRDLLIQPGEHIPMSDPHA